MDDLISRQAAIDLLKQMRKDGDMIPWEGKDVFARIRKLPPAQPELAQDLPNACTDAISRQAAIDAIGEKSDEIYKTKQKGATYPHDDFFQGMAYAEDVVKQLLPIQPKRGRWIYCEDTTADCVDGYRCDQCGFFVPWDYQHKSIDYIKDYNFCPNCGADMRGEQDEY